MTTRVYKFMKADHAISSLQEKRLKLSTVDALNDPFDLHAIATTNHSEEIAVMAVIQHLQTSCGLLCFSKNWDNLLLWSHYANCHTGVCLAFDIPDDDSHLDVLYQPNLLRIGDLLPDPLNFMANLNYGKRILCAKHESWSYEQEVRVFVDLTLHPADEHGDRWVEFSTDLQLKGVIIGSRCCTDTALKVCEAVLEYPEPIECAWAYMRRDAFLLVRDQPPPRANLFRPECFKV